jgi:hypothetical protein
MKSIQKYKRSEIDINNLFQSKDLFENKHLKTFALTKSKSEEKIDKCILFDSKNTYSRKRQNSHSAELDSRLSH